MFLPRRSSSLSSRNLSLSSVSRSWRPLRPLLKVASSLSALLFSANKVILSKVGFCSTMANWTSRGWYPKIEYMCCNYLSQWWVEFEFDLRSFTTTKLQKKNYKHSILLLFIVRSTREKALHSYIYWLKYKCFTQWICCVHF